MRERHNMQEQKPETNNSTMGQIVAKISTAENILIALSKNPSADELASAIGLSILLDKMGKHATAIYSGKTPSIIEFLEPEQRLETNTDSLQDFIIALNKSKADHLHYKVDGDYVKIYITPYKTKISEEDLEFSHGDFNIGLVVALNVTNENDLDQALTSHGRILHDAEIINITASAPGDFGGIQWSDPAASSISEMSAELAFMLGEELGIDIDGEVATALLAGIFVATERFSNNRTQPETMNMSARLMSVGANQQLISEYMKKAENGEVIENKEKDETTQEETGKTEEKLTEEPEKNDENLLVVQQKDTVKTEENTQNEYVQDAHTEQSDQQEEQVAQETPKETVGMVADRPILGTEKGFSVAEVADNPVDDKRPVLKPLGQESVAPVESTQTMNVQNEGPVHLEPLGTGLPTISAEGSNDSKTELGKMATPFEETPAPAFVDEKGTTMVGAPAPQPVENNSTDFSLPSLGAKSSVDESVMNELRNMPDSSSTSSEPLGKDYNTEPASEVTGGHEYLGDNPASAAAPGVSEGPEENHLPGLDFSNPVGMNEDEPAIAQNNNSYIIEPASEPQSTEQNTASMPSATLEPKPQGMPLPGDEILPPPPTPPVDFSAVKAEEVAPQVEPVVSQPLSAPAIQQNPVVQEPTTVVNQGPGLPQVDQSILGNESIPAPTSFQQPQPTVQPVAQPAPVNDPGAFRIPGT